MKSTLLPQGTRAPVRTFSCKNPKHKDDERQVFRAPEIPPEFVICKSCGEEMEEINVFRVDANGDVSISSYYSNGYMMILRSAMEPNNPNSTYGCLLALGLNPKNYGLEGDTECPCCGQSTTQANLRERAAEQSNVNLKD